MKKIIFSFLFSFLLFLNCYGNNFDNINSENALVGDSFCVENKYDINGVFDARVGNNLVFSLKNNLVGQTSSGVTVNYKIIKNGKTIKEKDSKKFSISFQDAGKMKLRANIIEKGKNCNYFVEKDINIYNKIISYISDKNDLNASFGESFNKNNIFLNKINPENKVNNSLQESFLANVTDKISVFNDSDIILINSDSYLQILQGFEKLKNIYNIDFENKKLYIVTDSDFILSKKLLNSFINTLKIKTYTFSTNNLLNFLNYISTGKSSGDLIKNKNYSINKISFDQTTNNYLFLTNFTNKLISLGFPIGILGILFSLGVAFTVINFIRQFVGFSVFSLYYPIFVALSIYLFNINITVVLFIASIFSIFCIRLILKRTHFLLNTKLSLYFVIYLIFSILIMGILNTYGFIDFSEIKTNMIIFPFILLPMVFYRIFIDDRKIFSFSFLFYVFEFVFVTYISYLIIKSNFIQNIFLAYSELLIVVLFLNFLIGKFTGLQLVEIFRFIPLIKRNLSVEEEE